MYPQLKDFFSLLKIHKIYINALSSGINLSNIINIEKNIFDASV